VYEGEMVKPMKGVNDDDGIMEATRFDEASSHSVEEGGLKVRRAATSSPRRRKKKALAVLGDSYSHPRR